MNYLDYLEPDAAPPDAEDFRRLLKAYASLSVYRSAVVDELILDHDFWRRPLRPDDLDVIDFSGPIGPESASSLSALAANRMLLCVNESADLVLPPDDDDRRWREFRDFFSERNRAAGALVRPLLERHALGYLEPGRAELRPGRGDLLRAIDAERERGHAAATCSKMIRRSSRTAADLERFQLVQFLGLAPTRRRALERVVDGWLAAIRPAARAAQTLIDPWRTLNLETAGQVLGLPVDLHACWQFYLPGSLTLANVTHALASRARPFRAVGALLFAALAIERFVDEHREVAAAAGLTRVDGELRALADALVMPLAGQYGGHVWTEVTLGFETCANAQRRSDIDLSTQLSWLARVDSYGALAREINDKIETEHIPVDRDTFVEPRAMCSTTHVHDDYRLVVVERGEMVFWGMPGMRLVLPPGDMMLVPRHRLHGSSVLTDECVYHQPIIPEDWIRPYEELAGEASA